MQPDPLRYGSTLIDLLCARVEGTVRTNGYTFLSAGTAERLTYAKLDHEARRVAAFLQTLGTAGERALLLFPPGLPYIVAFWGCVYAGVVGVPVYTPRSDASLPRLQATFADAGAKFVLSTSTQLERLARFVPQLPQLAAAQQVAIDTLETVDGASWQAPAITPDSIALLQYTSGSITAPKGVMLSHRNLLHNLAIIQRAFGVTPESRGVSWLPPYHDMGLIGMILEPLYGGADATLLSPFDFLQSPLRWLQAVSETRATISGGPNFAYDLCVERIGPEQRRGLDLSCWATAFTGAEPIHAETLQRFSRAFAECGFNQAAWYPCYGLAEATLIVSGGPRAALPPLQAFDARALEQHQAMAVPADQDGARTLVGCGEVLGDQDVRVVEPATGVELPDGVVGEIWLRGPSVAQGYWQQPAATAEMFHASPVEGDATQFLRTGDLGFFHNKILFVTGRIKDLIIIRGRNLYPQDIEWTARTSHPALYSGDCAAITIDTDGQPQLVIVQEVDRHALKTDLSVVAETIRMAVAAEHTIQVATIVLLKPGRLPKTSSGKVQRQLCRQRFLDNTFEPVYRSVPGDASALPSGQGDLPDDHYDELQVYLRDAAARLLRLAPTQLRLDQPLVAAGLDSLTALEFQFLIEQKFAVQLPLSLFFDGASLRELADAIGPTRPRSPSGAAESAINVASELAAPLSHGQRALWFLHRLEPGSLAYHIAVALRLGGRLDSDALKQALRQLGERHAMLRTIFVERGGEPFQQIQAELPAFSTIDAEGWDETRQIAYLADEAAQPFDLSSAPPIRLSLLMCGPDMHVLVCVVHHILVDFWSLALLLRDLDQLYAAARCGRAFPATTSPPYQEYVREQEALLAGDEVEHLWAYWRRQLAGGIPWLDLLTDRPRGLVAGSRGSIERLQIDRALADLVTVSSQAHGVTRYTTLLAAYAALLHRYTGQGRFVIGSPLVGRQSPRWAEVVGYFVNPVPLMFDFAGASSFAELLDRTRQTVQGALAHQALPLSVLVERLQHEQPSQQMALFQAMFIWQQTAHFAPPELALVALGATTVSLRLDDLTVEVVPIERRDSQAEITLALAESHHGLEATVEYNSELFDATSIRQLLGHYRTLLAAALADPAGSLASLPLLNAEEQVQLLRARRPAPLPARQPLTLQHAVERHAAHYPADTALVYYEQRLSYGELDRRAEQVAGWLCRYGIAPEQRVGVLLERSPDMIVLLLAALKAGAAYVPLDPAYPPERLAAMQNDAGLALLVTQRSLAGLLAPIQNLPAIEFLEDLREIPGAWPMPPRRQPHADQLAYVIYTSGSTGRPKGVAISHRSACALVDWACGVYAPADLAAVLATTSICFDLSIFEIFVTLSAGGTVVLARDALDLEAMGAYDRITLINTVPSAATELLRMRAFPASLRVINLAGEPLPRSLAQQLYSQTAVERVYNLYGPTEDTTYSTVALVARDDPRPPAIGSPIAGSAAYVLDAWLCPLPAGIVGDLYLSGVGLARGYLHQPDLTAERFLPDPFDTGAGGRMYRTGDLAYLRADGQLMFVGRQDHQVKLHGYRIELGEIESVLLQHPHVSAAAACIRTWTSSADSQLIVYLTAATPNDIDLESVRAWLLRRLPIYMLPARMLVLDALPLTANGKIDRKALLRLDDPARTGGALTRPQTPTEQAVAAIWQDLLHIAAVDVDDTFFALGGHSLLASQMLARLRDTFHVDLPLRLVFESPTVALIAQQIDQARGIGIPRDEPPLAPVARDVYRQKIPQTPQLHDMSLASHDTDRNPGNRVAEEDVVVLPASFAQQRLWFLDQLEPNNPAYIMPAAVLINGPLDVVALQHCLTALIERHETLRTALMAIDGEPVQVIADSVPLPWAYEHLRAEHPDDREALLQERLRQEVARPFVLSQAPLLRARLFCLDDQAHVLALTLHHSIADGWSLNILLRELNALYCGSPAGLPDLPIQYGDYVIWQRKWLEGQRLEQQLAYWRRQLADAPASLELPTDRPRPPLQTFNGALYRFVLPQELTQQLQAWAERAGCTLFMALLAAFQTLLYRYSGQADLIVGTPVAGRSRTETEELIGCFVNMLPLRSDLSGNPSFHTLAQRVRETCLAAFAHQDAPFEKLVNELQIARDLSRPLLVQAVLALQNMPPLAFDRLSMQPVRIDSGAAKFDLLLDLATEQDRLAGTVEYNTDLFDESTIAQMVAHWHTILATLAVDSGVRINDLALLTVAERGRVLAEWNRSAADYPRAALLQQLFEAQAARQPHAPAAVYETEQISYGALNARANQLAHYLRELGVGPDVPVAVCLERSLGMLVAILGVLKAGGAYVPLDPEYPAERLRYMLADSQAPVLLTAKQLRDRLPQHNARVVCLDGDWATISRQSAGNPARVSDPAHLAYIIYTSGSTGQPKGVMVVQRGVLNLCFGLRAFFDDPLVRNTALITSFSFDISVNQIFPTLLFGKTLHIIADSVKYDSRSFVNYLVQHEIHNFDAVPSYLNLVLSEMQPGRIANSVRYLLVGGEKLERRLLDKLFQQLGPEVTLINIYGLTEISDINAMAAITCRDTDGPVVIGRPLQNNRIYIVNRRDQLQPPRAVGELCIAGESLARGYWRRPDLTAEKFVPCPYEDGALMCRTGDVGYWLPDGAIVMLGRIDSQVKLRGFRIEVGEIEALIEQYPTVRECAAIVREDRPGDQRLVAYVVPRVEEPLSEGTLRSYLQERIPAYMLPTIVLLAELPHTPSGKIDRKRLPAPEPQDGGSEARYTPPSNATEAALVGIWQGVLGVERVGVDDHFFERGGHSLLATRVIMSIRREFGVSVPLRRMFEAPTIRHITHYIETARGLETIAQAAHEPLLDDSEEGVL